MTEVGSRSADPCFVCQKHRGEIEIPGGTIFEDDLVYSSHRILDPGQDSTYPGVLFVEPKRHVPGMAGLTRPEAERVGLLTSLLAGALESCEGAEHTYVEVLGHHVSHLHVWLVPRYPGLSREVWGVGLLGLSDAPRADSLQIEALCERVRDYLVRVGEV